MPFFISQNCLICLWSCSFVVNNYIMTVYCMMKRWICLGIYSNWIFCKIELLRVYQYIGDPRIILRWLSCLFYWIYWNANLQVLIQTGLISCLIWMIFLVYFYFWFILIWDMKWIRRKSLYLLFLNMRCCISCVKSNSQRMYPTWYKLNQICLPL